MKYIIESTDNGCVEIIEFDDGSKYIKEHITTDYGSRQLTDNFYEQMEKDGICEEILDKVCDVFDGFLASNFLDIAKFEC